MTALPPTAEPNFRLADPCDQVVVLGLIEAYYELDHIAFDEKVIRPGLAELLMDPSLGRVWLIEVNSQTAGYLILTFAFDLEFGGREATLTDLYLRPEFRIQGIGTAALRHLEEACRAWGVQAIELRVETDNHEAQALYQKLGFRKHERFTLSKRLK